MKWTENEKLQKNGCARVCVKGMQSKYNQCSLLTCGAFFPTFSYDHYSAQFLPLLHRNYAFKYMWKK